MRPFAPSPADRYSRLFPPFEDPLPINVVEEKLQRLADDMKADQSRMPLEILESDPVGAGYTYFGQFIDHDLTEDRSPFRLAGLVDPNDTENRRTPWLDLDSLYGHGPGCPDYKELYEEDAVSFRLGEVRVHGEAFDVPLKDGWPQLADPRNSENIIVRQIHAMFLKLHNLAVAEIKRTTSDLSSHAVFTEARQRLQWQYQWLVRHDFLKQICQPDIYNAVVENGQCTIDWNTDGFSIPVEFSQAAFRFGHSMVRLDYKLNDGIARLRLDKLFAEHKPGAIDPKLAVDWEQFLTRNRKPEFSMRIDTGIATPLFDLPDASIHLFVSTTSPHGPKALPLRTLLRGSRNKLPIAEQVREQLCPASVLLPPRKVIDHPYDPLAIVRELELYERIPLWYYVLLESELNENGLRLGELGSRLVLEVIEGALSNDPGSFLAVHGNGWSPPPWEVPGRDRVPIRTLFDVATLVGLTTTHPHS